jgi:anthranilate/para-aminobenzoate synthase component I
MLSLWKRIRSGQRPERNGFTRAQWPHDVGGGWVNDSDPEAEFQETVNKSKAMLKAVALAENFDRR